ncbi:MAG: hypothetical protein C5B47_03895 [Verrucomicrobia bacterium]|nr:MAG: hypothetical protein C5B47_03895 [Verrucomicrobiota bacterium]
MPAFLNIWKGFKNFWAPPGARIQQLRCPTSTGFLGASRSKLLTHLFLRQPLDGHSCVMRKYTTLSQ